MLVEISTGRLSCPRTKPAGADMNPSRSHARARTLAPTFLHPSMYGCRAPAESKSGQIVPEMAFRVTRLGLGLMSLTATTAVTSTAEERCYNQPAYFSISAYSAA